MRLQCVRVRRVRLARHRRQHWRAPKRRQRSARSSLLIEVRDGAVETDSATVPAGDACEHVVHRWHRGQAREFRGQVLLEGLPGRLGAALKTRVHFIWEITYENVRHACILLSISHEHNHVLALRIGRSVSPVHTPWVYSAVRLVT